jgi:hypothetical protein
VGASESSEIGALSWVVFAARCLRISVAAGAKSSTSSGSAGTGSGCALEGCLFGENSGKGSSSSREVGWRVFRGDCLI